MMTKKTLHWILGLLVMVSLIVISLPLWLSHARKGLENPLRAMPPFPDELEQVIPTVDVLQKESVDVIAPAQAPKPDAKPNNTESEKSAAKINSHDKLSVSHEIDRNIDLAIKKQFIAKPSWAVVVGTFNNKLNALKMLDTLRANGYPAFMQDAQSDDIRVFIGPANEQSEAHLLAEQVNAQLHLQSMIINYQPLVL